MKTNFRKIALAIAASLSLAAPAFADDVTMPVTASVHSPMTINLVNGLSMGGLTRATGSVTVAASAAGTVSTTGSMLSLGGARAGHVRVSGDVGSAYSVTVPTGNAVMTGGGTLIFGSATTSLAGGTGTFSSGADDIYIGGTVTSTDGSAPFGSYTYSFPVSITYN